MWLDGKYGSISWGLSAIERHSYDNGKTWSQENVLTQRPDASWPFSPYFRVIDSDVKNGNSLAVSWNMDDSVPGFGYKIKTRINLMNKPEWCPEIFVTPNSDYAINPTIVANNYRVIVGWKERNALTHDFYQFVRTVRYSSGKQNTYLKRKVLIDRATIDLLQNNPNPFNLKTRLTFVLYHASNVSLKIYNLIGQEIVALLLDEDKHAGEHDVQFDASTLASGIYYYRIFVRTEEGDEYFTTNKMILMK